MTASIEAKRILVVEDNPDLADNLGDYLSGRGARVDYALDGLTALHLASTESYDALILDVMLPGVDGLEICRRLRRDAGLSAPILMLTARDTLDDKLAGFSAGTDDYLVKPFALEEVGARLDALLRRARPAGGEALTVADLALHRGTREVRRGGRTIHVTRTGFTLLETLMEAAPRVVSREELEQRLWGDDPPDSDALRSHLYSLRRVVDRDATPLIHTVHGVGYRVAAVDEP